MNPTAFSIILNPFTAKVLLATEHFDVFIRY